jgi:hypothetical protein
LISFADIKTWMTVLKVNNLSLSAVLPFLLTVGAIACAGPRKAASTPTLINQEIAGRTGAPILLGPITREALSRPNYRPWFDEEYNTYTADEKTLEGARAALAEVDILAFIGTWCEDSRRELPRFFKILDFLAHDESKLRLIALDNHYERYKQSPGGEEKGWNIEYVPTFIIRKAGREIGRIVESPMESLEKDLVRIVRTH